LIPKKPVEYVYEAAFFVVGNHFYLHTELSDLLSRTVLLIYGLYLQQCPVVSLKMFVRYCLKREYSLTVICSVFHLDLKVDVVEPH
jgi:hypothetical protein